MDLATIALPLAVSIIIGALIGLEREKTKQTTKGLSAVGIRTDILISLFGAIAAFLGQEYHPVLFIFCLAALLIFNITSYIYMMFKFDRLGVTTEISTILVFLYGALTMAGYMQLAVILAITTTLILSVREYLHEAIYKINYRELFDTIKFAIIAFIILPFLPNKNFDIDLFHFFFPDQEPPKTFSDINVLNPYNIWLLVVLVSGISFLGYILVKTLGKKRGIGFAGLLGGLYSSSATALTLSSKSKELPKTKIPFIAGITLACATSFIRTYIEMRALNEELFFRTFIPVGLMFLYLLCIGIYLMLISQKEKIDSTKSFETPFSLKKAIKLGAYIVGTLLLSKILLSYASINWYYVIATATALLGTDDPIIISTSATAGTLINFTDAKNIILLVLYINMFQKVIFMYFFGNRKLTKHLAFIMGGLALVTLGGVIYF